MAGLCPLIEMRQKGLWKWARCLVFFSSLSDFLTGLSLAQWAVMQLEILQVLQGQNTHLPLWRTECSWSLVCSNKHSRFVGVKPVRDSVLIVALCESSSLVGVCSLHALRSGGCHWPLSVLHCVMEEAYCFQHSQQSVCSVYSTVTNGHDHEGNSIDFSRLSQISYYLHNFIQSVSWNASNWINSALCSFAFSLPASADLSGCLSTMQKHHRDDGACEACSGCD